MTLADSQVMLWLPVKSWHFILWLVERLAENLRLTQAPAVLSQGFLCFRVLLLKMSSNALTSLWPTIITELVSLNIYYSLFLILHSCHGSTLAHRARILLTRIFNHVESFAEDVRVMQLMVACAVNWRLTVQASAIPVKSPSFFTPWFWTPNLVPVPTQSGHPTQNLNLPGFLLSRLTGMSLGKVVGLTEVLRAGADQLFNTIHDFSW